MAIHFSGKNGISIVTNLGQFIRVESVQVYWFFFFLFFRMVSLCNKGCLALKCTILLPQVPTLPRPHKTGFFCIVQAVLNSIQISACFYLLCARIQGMYHLLICSLCS